MASASDKLRSYLKQVASLAKNYGNLTLEERFDVKIKEAEEPVALLFCGEFKRGKSTLVNAILGDELCPTDIGIATSVVTYIKYGPEKRAVRYYGDLSNNYEGLKQEEIAWESVGRYAVGGGSDIAYTALIELTYPSPILKDGIVMIDTPGLGGVDPRHAVLTRMALPKADSILYVTYADEPITESELNFFSREIVPLNKPNLVLVNKAELIDQELALHMENTRKEIAKIAESPVVPVSAYHWQLFTQLQEENLLKSSNRDEVVKLLHQLVEKVRQDRYCSLRNELLSEVNEMAACVNAELQQLSVNEEDRIKHLDELKAEYNALLAFRDKFRDPNSEIRLRVNQLFESTRNDVLNLIAYEGTNLTSSEFDKLLSSDRALENEGKWFVAQINEQLAALSSRVDRSIEQSLNKISEVLDKNILSEVTLRCGYLSDKVEFKDRMNSQLLASVSGKVMQGSFIASIPAGIAAFLFGGPVGAVVGIASLAAFVWSSLVGEDEQRRRHELRQHLLPKLNLAITELKNQTNSRFLEIQQNMIQTVQTILTGAESKLKSVQGSIGDSLAEKKRSDDQNAELNRRKKFCEVIVAQLKLLYHNPFEDAERRIYSKCNP